MSRFQIRVNVTLRPNNCLPFPESPSFFDAFKQSLEGRLNDSGLVYDACVVEIIKRKVESKSEAHQ